VTAWTGLIRDVPDFPQPGILFKDITPVLADPSALRSVVHDLAAPFHDAGITAVAGVEARGFLLAAPVALALGAGVVPVRKPGKLPSAVREQSYDLEYGTATLQVHTDAVGADDTVLLIDDVLATGGTAAAAASLLRAGGATVAALAVLLELTFLPGRAALDGLPVHAAHQV
jgi:adenine phosphoribosyltransferase